LEIAFAGERVPHSRIEAEWFDGHDLRARRTPMSRVEQNVPGVRHQDRRDAQRGGFATD
jgi:hypothetical protein